MFSSTPQFLILSMTFASGRVICGWDGDPIPYLVVTGSWPLFYFHLRGECPQPKLKVAYLLRTRAR
jgi:hypothetical protein